MTRDYESLLIKHDALRRQVLPGLYRHHKGGIYCFDRIVFDQETEDARVDYHDERHPTITWSIPLENWLEELEIEGRKVMRFTWLAQEVGGMALSDE